MYLEQIEVHFSQKRDQGLILSPKEWQLAQEWHDAGIPISVVLRGINHTFEQADSSKNIRSLTYCTPEIKKLWDEYKERMAEANFDEDYQINTPYKNQLEDLKNCLAAKLNEPHPPELLSKLHQLNKRFQELFEGELTNNWEDILRQITNNLISCLKQSVTPRLLTSIEIDIRKILQKHETKMSKAAYYQTFCTLINRRLLEMHDLAPFALYAD